jgi:hypothetical protein
MSEKAYFDYELRADGWYWILLEPSGEGVGYGGPFQSLPSARRAAERLKAAASEADVEGHVLVAVW